jgi:hypothetical protein
MAVIRSELVHDDRFARAAACYSAAGRGGGVLRAHGAGLRAKVNADQPLIL